MDDRNEQDALGTMGNGAEGVADATGGQIAAPDAEHGPLAVQAAHDGEETEHVPTLAPGTEAWAEAMRDSVYATIANFFGHPAATDDEEDGIKGVSA